MAELEAELPERIASGEVADTDAGRLLFRLLGLSRIYVKFVASNAGRWAALLAFNRSRANAATDGDYLRLQESLIDIIGDVLVGSPLRQDEARRRVAARALWSAVHGIVSMNYFGADEGRAVERTWAQIELLVTTFVAGIFNQSMKA